jgi:cell division protein FtsL
MTPPPSNAGTATAGRLRTGTAPRTPRRSSGPAVRRRPAGRAGGTTAAPGRFEVFVRGLPDARWLDRLLRGRAWIALVACALMGIVFMQVSLLKLNSGISRAVTAADTLERQNSQLRADVSSLEGENRVQDAAARSGLVLPGAGEVTYLDARHGSDARAASAIRAPDEQRAALLADQWHAHMLGWATPGASGTATGATAAGAPGTTASAGAGSPSATATPTTPTASAASAGTATTPGTTSAAGTTGTTGTAGSTGTPGTTGTGTPGTSATSGTSGTAGTTGTTGTAQPGTTAATGAGTTGTAGTSGTGALAAPAGG